MFCLKEEFSRTNPMGRVETLKDVSNYLSHFLHRPNVIICRVKEKKIVEEIPFKGCMCYNADSPTT